MCACISDPDGNVCCLLLYCTGHRNLLKVLHNRPRLDHENIIALHLMVVANPFIMIAGYYYVLS